MTEEERGAGRTKAQKCKKIQRSFRGLRFVLYSSSYLLWWILGGQVKKDTQKSTKHLWLPVDGQLCPRGLGSTLNSCTLLCTCLSLPKNQTSSVSKPVCGFCSLLLLQTSSRLHSSDDCRPSSDFQWKSISVSCYIILAPKFKKALLYKHHTRYSVLCTHSHSIRKSTSKMNAPGATGVLFISCNLSPPLRKLQKAAGCKGTTQGDPCKHRKLLLTDIVSGGGKVPQSSPKDCVHLSTEGNSP